MKPFELTVLMYHYVHDPGDAAEAGSGIPGLSLSRFEAQLDQLTRRYTMITWADLQHCLGTGKELPTSACLLTFDDGTCDHYLNVFPALQKRGLSGLFFTIARTPDEGLILGHKIHFLLAELGLDETRDLVKHKLTPGQVARYQQAEHKYRPHYSELDTFKAILQRDLSIEVEPLLSDMFAESIGSEEETARRYYLSPEQIMEMSAGGMRFGGHSHSHPWFDWITADQRSVEINASASALRSIETGLWAFAYPYGGLSADTSLYLAQAGFVAAFTTKPLIRHHDPFYIGRVDGEDLLPSLDNLSLLVNAS